MKSLLSTIKRYVLSNIQLIMGGVKVVGLNRFSLFGQLIVNGAGNVIEIYSPLPKSVQLHFYGNNHHLIIDKGVVFKKGVVWFEDNGCEIRIGDKTTIMDAHLAVAEDGRKLIIGSDCMFSSGIYIATTDSHSIIDLQTDERTNPAADIKIGNHVWIGRDVTVKKGCTISNNSIIGGNTVVTKDVPANAIFVGIPGRVVRTGVTWDRKRL